MPIVDIYLFKKVHQLWVWIWWNWRKIHCLSFFEIIVKRKTVVRFMWFTIFIATFNTIESNFPLVSFRSWATSEKAQLLLKSYRSCHINDYKFLLYILSCCDIKMEPDIVPMSVDIVLQEQIVITCFFASKCTVEVASLEICRKRKTVFMNRLWEYLEFCQLIVAYSST